MTDHKPLTKEKMAWTGNYQDIDAWRDEDVRSAVKGLRSVIMKEHLHFKGNGKYYNNKYMADYTEEVLLSIDRWFPVFAEEEKP